MVPAVYTGSQIETAKARERKRIGRERRLKIDFGVRCSNHVRERLPCHVFGNCERVTPVRVDVARLSPVSILIYAREPGRNARSLRSIR